MAYDSNNLSATSYANGSTRWHYKSRHDGIEEMLADGYFGAAGPMLRVGDEMALNGGTDWFHSNRDGQDGIAFVKSVEAEPDKGRFNVTIKLAVRA